ncbi:MAG: AI-2E family transporter [Gemmatimonadota bacterium]
MSEENRVTVWRVVQASGVLVVMGFFLFETLPILNPALLFLLLWGVLMPFRGREGYGVVLTIAAILTLIWILSTAGSVLAPFVLAIALAYILDPLVDRLEARKVPRGVSVLILTVPTVAILAALALIFIPSAFRQIGEIVQGVPVFIERIDEWYAEGERWLAGIDVPFLDGAALVAQIQAVDSDAIIAFVQERQDAFGQWLWDRALGLGRGLGSVTTVLSYVILTPVLLYYLIRDWDRVIEQIGALVPLNRQDAVSGFAKECDQLVSSYMRGQFTVAFIIGILTGLGYMLLGFPYAATLGLVAGVFSVVPYLGGVITLIPAIFIALVSGNVLWSLATVAIVFVGVQILDGSLISPRIVGDSVGIHPVWVVLAMTLGGYYFGVLGLLVAVPVAAIIKLLIGYGLERYLASGFYQGTDSALAP